MCRKHLAAKRSKAGNMNPEAKRGTKTRFSTGDLKDRKRLGKIGGIENSDFARSRAETYSGLPSYFCDYSNTATCNNCLFGEVQGRQFS